MSNGSLLTQYRPNGVTKVVSSRDSSSRGICQNPLVYWHQVWRLFCCFLASQDSRQLKAWDVPAGRLLGQVNTDFAIRFEDWGNYCTPFCWSCHRRDNTALFKHCLHLTFHSPFVTEDEPGFSSDCMGKMA